MTFMKVSGTVWAGSLNLEKRLKNVGFEKYLRKQGYLFETQNYAAY